MSRAGIDAIAMRCSPSVLALNSGVFGESLPPPPAPLGPKDVLTLHLHGYCPRGVNPQRGRHWAVVAREKRTARSLLLLAMAKAGVSPKAGPAKKPARTGEQWRLHVVRHGVRDLDGDNLTGAYKQLQDALVDVGLLPFDDWKTLRATHDQTRAKRGETGTTLTLWKVCAS